MNVIAIGREQPSWVVLESLSTSEEANKVSCSGVCKTRNETIDDTVMQKRNGIIIIIMRHGDWYTRGYHFIG